MAGLAVASGALWVVASVAGAGPRVGLASQADPSTVHAPEPDDCAAPAWVAAWSAAAQDTSAAAPPSVGGVATGVFTDQTIRMVVTPLFAGSEVRLHLGNRFGAGPVTLGAVSVAPRASGAAIVAGASEVVTFGEQPAVTIPPGATVVSDPVPLAVEAFDDVAVSIHVAGTASLDVHHQTNVTHYATPASSGVHVADVDGAAFSGALHSSLALVGMDVLAPRRAEAVAVVGDSITDGIGSTMDADRRWPDELARRLLARPADQRMAVLNLGISGNQVAFDNVRAQTEVVRGAGPSAATRLAPDALSRAGVTHVVLFAGINDIYAPSGEAPALTIIAAYTRIIEQAHAAGVRVVGSTITPAALDGPMEAARVAVNQWVRTSGAFDAVVDFDAVVRDPADPARLAPGYGADTVHLTDAGAAAVGQSVDLRLLQPAACAPS